jgi:Leucine-rich repeat (LRR) protein
MGNLPKLESMDFTGNSIKTLPEELPSLPCLKKCVFKEN